MRRSVARFIIFPCLRTLRLPKERLVFFNLFCLLVKRNKKEKLIHLIGQVYHEERSISESQLAPELGEQRSVALTADELPAGVAQQGVIVKLTAHVPSLEVCARFFPHCF